MTLPGWILYFVSRDDDRADSHRRGTARRDLGDRHVSARDVEHVAAAARPAADARDTALATHLRSQDEAVARTALEAVYREYAAALANFANSFLHSPADARDVVADVFVQVWSHRDTFTPSSGIAAYFYAATRHRALNHLRNSGRRTRHDAKIAGEVAGGGEPSFFGQRHDAESSAELVERDETVKTVREAMDRLPPERRRVMQLRWRDGLSNGEIAGILGISEKTVRNQLSLGLSQLRVVLSSLLRDS